MDGTLYITGDAEADRLLNTDPFALLIGMLLDQQVPMAWAFRGPASLKERLGYLDPARIAALPPDDVVAAFTRKPALHRFPAVMARRVHDLALFVTDNYYGDAGRIWTGVATGGELFGRLQALPGFGDEKAKIFLALLAQRMGVAPEGWREAAAPFGDGMPRSVADSSDPESLARVRQWKQAQRAAHLDKQGRPLTPG
ncbi:MAG TPA: HhH-GPD-type base excision DNA repair protein [Acidimicrobiales bacterium]|nr:HhH-GPD-type base excision DNA repair protein [Acidimicrobiales bacterium]